MSTIRISRLDSVVPHCDLYNAGMTEDGEDFLAECYCAMVRFASGVQYTHNKVFLGCDAGVVDDDETGQYNGLPYFGDIRKEAKEAVDRLVARVEEAGCIDDTYWTEVEPSYGSEAYCSKYGF